MTEDKVKTVYLLRVEALRDLSKVVRHVDSIGAIYVTLNTIREQKEYIKLPLNTRRSINLYIARHKPELYKEVEGVIKGELGDSEVKLVHTCNSSIAYTLAQDVPLNCTELICHSKVKDVIKESEEKGKKVIDLSSAESIEKLLNKLKGLDTDGHTPVKDTPSVAEVKPGADAVEQVEAVDSPEDSEEKAADSGQDEQQGEVRDLPENSEGSSESEEASGGSGDSGSAGEGGEGDSKGESKTPTGGTSDKPKRRKRKSRKSTGDSGKAKESKDASGDSEEDVVKVEVDLKGKSEEE